MSAIYYLQLLKMSSFNDRSEGSPPDEGRAAIAADQVKVEVFMRRERRIGRHAQDAANQVSSPQTRYCSRLCSIHSLAA